MADSDKDLKEDGVKKKKYSGRYCVASGCKQCFGERSKQQGITFHAFPWSNQDLVKMWEQAMHRKAFKATRHVRLCSNHFTPDCFDRSGIRVRLRPGAIPTIFAHHHKPITERNGRKLMPDTSTPPFGLPVHLDSAAQNRKTLTERNGHESMPDTSTTTTPSSIKRSYVPISEPSCKRFRKCCSAVDNISMSVASEAAHKLTISAHKLMISNGHTYSVPSPTMLKHRLNKMESTLAKYKRQVKTLKQKNRRLQSRVDSLQQSCTTCNRKI